MVPFRSSQFTPARASVTKIYLNGREIAEAVALGSPRRSCGGTSANGHHHRRPDPGAITRCRQAAINAAAAGDTIVLDSGVTFTEDIVLPTTQHATPVVIKSSTAAPSRRVALSDAATMATIMPVSVDEPAVKGDGVKGWEFEFVRFYRNTHCVNPCFFLLNVSLGGGTFRNRQNITFDRCLIDGGASGAWANGLYCHGAFTA